MNKVDPRIARLQNVAVLLDSKFRIPFTQFRIGVDGILGLVPFYGDAASFLLSLGLIIMIARMGVPASVLIRVCANTLLDFVMGVVPFVGDVADVFFKSNMRNVRLAQKFFEQPRKVSVQSWVLIGGVSTLIILFLVAIVGSLLWLVFQMWNYLLQTV